MKALSKVILEEESPECELEARISAPNRLYQLNRVVLILISVEGPGNARRVRIAQSTEAYNLETSNESEVGIDHQHFTLIQCEL